jgi:hypothetical protein
MNYDPNSLVQTVSEVLGFYAANNEAQSYETLAKLLGLPKIGGRWMGHPLQKAFDACDRADAAASRPFRTSMVVQEVSKRPGDGFYESLRKLKGARVGNEQERKVAYQAERAAAVAHAAKVGYPTIKSISLD